MKTKNKRSSKENRVASSSRNKVQKKNKNIRTKISSKINKPKEQPAAEDSTIQAEAERRELSTPLWAVNLERPHEE
jgi:hypothetical protein